MSEFVQKMERQFAALTGRDRSAKAAGQIVGRYIAHPYADGQAIYEIVSATQATATIHVAEIGDAWVLPAWGRQTRLSRQKVEQFLASRDAIDAMFSRNEGWWDMQPIGRVVHYCNGSGAYVRGVVVDHDGKRQMRPIALVGEWRCHDLPKRLVDGTEYFPYHAERVRDGVISQSNASVMWEGGYSSRPGQPDPTNMEPIPLVVPPATPEQQEVTRLYNLREAAKAAMETEDGVNPSDPVQHALAIRNALARCKRILEGV